MLLVDIMKELVVGKPQPHAPLEGNDGLERVSGSVRREAAKEGLTKSGGARTTNGGEGSAWPRARLLRMVTGEGRRRGQGCEARPRQRGAEQRQRAARPRNARFRRRWSGWHTDCLRRSFLREIRERAPRTTRCRKSVAAYSRSADCQDKEAGVGAHQERGAGGERTEGGDWSPV